MTHLYKTKAPSLPIPQIEYDYSQQEQFLYALRLYFNQIDKALLNLANTEGGGWLHFPHAMFVSLVDQKSSANDTPTLAVAEVNSMASGVSYSAGQISITKNGTYRIQYSLQLSNTDTVAHDATTWFKKNGTNVDNSGFIFDVRSSHGGVEGHTVGATEFLIDLTAEDYIELWWAADKVKTNVQDGVFIQNFAAAVAPPYARPDVPSVIIIVTFVCAAL